MATDRARRSHDAGRMYRSVVAQQGRVTVEADINEAEEIRAGEARAALVDVIGPTGSHDDGFKISIAPSPHPPFDFAIGAGTLYAGGVRLQNTARAATYRGQQATEWADYPADAAAADPTSAARELIYLEVTERELGAVEDPALREVALGGPDTAGRTRMIQRVHRVQIVADGCSRALTELETEHWNPARELDRATMRLHSTARLKVGFTAPSAVADPCQPTAQVGFLGAENQLIRVQVGRTASGPALLWGYDNASFLYRATIDTTRPRQLTLGAAPVDAFHRPRPGQWVELLATAVALDGGAAIAAPVGQAVQVDSFDPAGPTLILRADAAAELRQNPSAPVFVRVWENLQPFAVDENTATELVTPEQVGTGVQVWTRGTPSVAGDHWLIGVRPSVPGAIFPARLTADFQPPDGPSRWVVPLAVITWQDDQTGTVTDCRLPFRSLVSDDDLEFHNKHLHGWGVVCGLQVNCMTTDYAAAHNLPRPSEHVIVRDGYAIHPTGADIKVRSAAGDGITPVPLGDLAVDAGLTRTGGVIQDGAVSLWIDRQGVFRADLYDPTQKQTWQERLEGTLLLDIFNDCVVKVFDYINDKLAPKTGDGPAGPAARQLIALINLFWQLRDPTNGPRIFLSGINPGDPPVPGHDTEDALLREFFEGLKGLLQSKTFCAMFDDVVYPAYDIARADIPKTEHPTTMFGAGFHSRMRLPPTGELLYTFGDNGKVNVYHRVRQVLIDVVDFPVAGAQIQDIAFSPDGQQVYAIAWTGTSHTDSVFVVGEAIDEKLQWTGTQVSCPDMKLCMLALFDERGETIVASVRGQGLFRFSRDGTGPSPLFEFRATGHLVTGRFGSRTILYAGEDAAQTHPTAFTRVLGFDVEGQRTLHFQLPPSGNDPGVGQDDLAVITSRERDADDLYAIIDGATGHKRLVAWDPTDPQTGKDEGAPPLFEIDLGPSGGNRIAAVRGGELAMITYFDANIGRTYRPRRTELEPHIHPLQIGPMAIAADARSRFYVLEVVSNTVTKVPVRNDGSSSIDLARLDQYRRDALTVFLKLVGRTIQFLKDCVCEHLLVNCPTGQGKVYLADVSFKDGAIYQICNFHHRKYVHTFPTVEYWLSLVPIIPLLKFAVEKLCCTPIAGFFDEVLERNQKGNTKAAFVSPTMIHNAMTYIRAADLPGNLGMMKSQAALGAGLAKASIADKLRRPSPGNTAASHSAIAVAMKSPDEATRIAHERGITIRRVEPSGGDLRSVFSAITTIATPPVARGETVDLVTGPGGRVLGWRKAPPTPPSPPSPPAPPTSAPPTGPTPPDEIAALRAELAKMTAAHARHEAALAEMKKQLADMASKITPKRR